MTLVTISLNSIFFKLSVIFQTENNENRIINHVQSLHKTGKSSYFTREKMNMHTPPFTEWEHKLQQHLSQVMVHMVAIRGIKQE